MSVLLRCGGGRRGRGQPRRNHRHVPATAASIAKSAAGVANVSARVTSVLRIRTYRSLRTGLNLPLDMLGLNPVYFQQHAHKAVPLWDIIQSFKLLSIRDTV